MKKFASALVASVSLLALAPSANAIILDDFGQTAMGGVISLDGNTLAAPLVNDTSFGISNLGSTRIVNASTMPAGGLTIVIDDGLADGFFTHNGNTLVDTLSSVTYELGGTIDLTNGGIANAFRLDIFSTDINGELFVTAGGETVSVPVAGASSIDFLFSDFAGFDAANATGSIAFGVSGTSVDIVIDTFSTVCSGNTASGSGSDSNACRPPVTVSEPASLGLLGLGLLGLGVAARRRK